LFGGGRLAFRGACGLGLFALQPLGIGGGGGHTGGREIHKGKHIKIATKENRKYRELD
jgi:hypothetical protein